MTPTSPTSSSRDLDAHRFFLCATTVEDGDGRYRLLLPSAVFSVCYYYWRCVGLRSFSVVFVTDAPATALVIIFLL